MPINYNLDMKTYFDPVVEDVNNKSDEWFEGRVVITINVLNVTQFIVFHCDPSLLIQPDSVEIINRATNQQIQVRSDQHYYDDNQFYKIVLDTPLSLGEYDLKMDYKGDFGPSTNLYGFYKTVYQEDYLTKYSIS